MWAPASSLGSVYQVCRSTARYQDNSVKLLIQRKLFEQKLKLAPPEIVSKKPFLQKLQLPSKLCNSLQPKIYFFLILKLLTLPLSGSFVVTEAVS